MLMKLIDYPALCELTLDQYDTLHVLVTYKYCNNMGFPCL